MPISLTPETDHGLCQGHCSTIDDEDAVAEIVAKVMVGHFRHVQQIIVGADAKSPRVDIHAVANAKAALTVAPDADPWHRDGLVFQIISWIAACKSAMGAAVHGTRLFYELLSCGEPFRRM